MISSRVHGHCLTSRSQIFSDLCVHWSHAYHFVFIKKTNSGGVILMVYLYDNILSRSDYVEIQSTKKSMQTLYYKGFWETTIFFWDWSITFFILYFLILTEVCSWSSTKKWNAWSHAYKTTMDPNKLGWRYIVQKHHHRREEDGKHKRDKQINTNSIQIVSTFHNTNRTPYIAIDITFDLPFETQQPWLLAFLIKDYICN